MDLRGLSETEATERLAAEGPNELPRQGHRTLAKILRDVLREPMLALLVGGGIVYLILGDIHEALILVAFACLSVLITVTQESRTERAVEALRDLTSPRALVVRDGVRKRIAGREVVRGDLVILAEGDRVPADGVILENDGLHVDESLLTGESVPVRKTAGDNMPDPVITRPGGEDSPFVFSGSLVVRGSGLCRICATGPASEIGRIGGALAGIEAEPPRLQRQTRRLVFWMALAGGAASLLCVLLYGLLRGSWLDAALAGIALGMSMLPEEFPMVLTVFMAMGAMRMSRARVLTRRAAAIETLGSATVLCTDKTGTLTENRMRIAELRLPDGRIVSSDDAPFSLEEDFRRLAELGILASAEQPVDPMEQAFHALGDAHEDGRLRGHQQRGWTLSRHYPLDPALLAMSHVWSNEGPDDHVIATKGAPEAIGELCRMDAAEMDRLREAVDAMASEGLRVLGVAEARWSDGTELPETQRDFAFAFRGLVGLADPLRASVPDAVRQCREAGIRVVMITGDYPRTAMAIARKAGIDAGAALTGDEISRMDDAELARSIASVAVFARIMPEQKLRIVNALKATGEIVAMTGDGVNDAPSLKAAHIGIAMGGRGTDVAREASSIVLLDDDFGSIARAVRLGRRIYDNLRKAMAFIIAVHIPIAGLALLPLLTGMPLLLGPIHIAFLEMIIDPVCSLAFEGEREERDLMRRPPRAPDAPIFSRWLVAWAILQGLVTMLVVVTLTLFLWDKGEAVATVRSAAFLALVLGTLGLILVNRAFSASLINAVRRPGLPLVLVVTTVAIVLTATQLVPAIAGIFQFERVGVQDLLLVGLAGLLTLLVLEIAKPLWRRRLAG